MVVSRELEESMVDINEIANKLQATLDEKWEPEYVVIPREALEQIIRQLREVSLQENKDIWYNLD